MSAIPTKYKGVQFRSRLEARWACLFDLLGWNWEYEPIDLDGYIPDFIVQFNRPILFEVKPILEWPCSVDGCNCHGYEHVEYNEAISKIRASGWGKWAVIVGAAFPRAWMGFSTIGHGIYPNVDAVDLEQIGFCSKCRSVESFTRIDDCRCGRSLEVFNPDVYWREAGNRVQWRAPR